MRNLLGFFALSFVLVGGANGETLETKGGVNRDFGGVNIAKSEGGVNKEIKGGVN